MTNGEINLQIAVRALEQNLLQEKEKGFIESIKDYTKKDLQKMKNYSWLQDIARRYADKINTDPPPAKELSEEQQRILQQLNLIDATPNMRPNFKLLNYADNEEDEIETDWMPLDLESAQVLVNWLRTKFPMLK